MQTYNIPDAEDVAYAQNTIIIAGGNGTKREEDTFGLGANGVLGGGDDGPLTYFDTSVLGFQDLEGVGYNPDRGTLFILSTQASNSYLGEVSTSGTLLYAYNLAYLGANPRWGIAVRAIQPESFTQECLHSASRAWTMAPIPTRMMARFGRSL